MKHIIELDAIRALAAFRVMMFHLHPEWIVFPVPGVDVFFVLSGFLVTSIIMAKKSSRNFFLAFHGRRILRIVPNYFLGLMFVMAVIPLASSTPQAVAAWPYFATFTQFTPAYWGAQMPPFSPRFQHTWTLAIEVQFYVLYPLLVYYMPARLLLRFLGGMLVVSFVLRETGLPVFLLLTRWDGLILGGIIALLRRPEYASYQKRGAELLFTAGGISLVFLIAGSILFGSGFSVGRSAPWPGVIFLAINLLSAALVLAVLLNAGRHWTGFLRARWLTYLGQISYGLYLYHLLAYWVVDGVDQRLLIADRFSFLATDLLKVLLTLVVSIVSWKLIEKPILNLKSYFRYEAQAPVPVVTESRTAV